MKVAFSYSWFLPKGDLAQVRAIIEQLRQHAIEFGGEASDVAMLTDEDAQAVQPRATQAVLFSAMIPGATEGKYGLASSEGFSWSWNGAVVISDVRTVNELHAAAAALGLEVVEAFAGMVFTSRRNNQGKVEVEQQSAFDGNEF